MIDLGLARITALLKHLGNPHLAYRSVHVAGTNGKGSTVAFIASMLTASSIRNGRFTSPHLLHYHDCISIDDQVYPQAKFVEVSNLVQQYNLRHGLQCTEFELLTATAYKIFELERVELAVVEVGVGGRLDATNVLQPPQLVATAITKVAMDHQGLLGHTLAAIAYEKAGIIKPAVPVAVDATNVAEVRHVIDATAATTHSPVDWCDGARVAAPLLAAIPLRGAFQRQNLAVALSVLESIRQQDARITPASILSGLQATNWPARLQKIELGGVELLVDGAHNGSAAVELAKFLDAGPTRQNGVVFIIAMTKGKDVDELLKILVRRADSVVVTHFTIPENMPWIRCAAEEEIMEVAKRYAGEVVRAESEEVRDVVAQAVDVARGRPIVVCGSLYLGSDVLRAASEASEASEASIK
ncbi:Dihydrofolate synthetase [[Candida] zeylanoides]